jgi:photosystem II stability/assembly factor-like uncharacterized protein
MKSKSVLAIVALLAVFVNRGWAPPPLTAFTYQGRLTAAGLPVNGLYDFRLAVFNDELEGATVGLRVDVFSVPVSNGLFTVECDPGEGVFDGGPRWLQIAVRTNGGSLTSLSPRQRLTATPHAGYALSAGRAGTLQGLLPASQIAGMLSDSQLSANIARVNAPASFTGTVSAVQFIGDGSGITNLSGQVRWQTPAPSQVDAAPNTGYLLSQTSEVAITLPATPQVGDIVRVSGAGAGGWRLAQRTGQRILTQSLFGFGIGWVVLQTNRNVVAVACSSDGMRVLAAFAGLLHTSTDAGYTWATRGTSNGWWAGVASSLDGRRLVAVADDAPIYTSDDGGRTWMPRDVARSWRDVASSGNGAKLVAAVSFGQIYTSTDYGVTWTARDTNRWWACVASSEDGTKLVAGAGFQTVKDRVPDRIYISHDSGQTWVATGPSQVWKAVASSADGMKLVALPREGTIYTSTNGGDSWTPFDESHPDNWQELACSADGAEIMAKTDSGIHVSTDSGATWTFTPCSDSWSDLALSADGTRAFASGQNLWCSATATLSDGTGHLRGEHYATIELQYVGSGQFLPLSFTGKFNQH